MTLVFPYGIVVIFRYPARWWIALVIAVLLALAWKETRTRMRILRDDPWWYNVQMAVLRMPSVLRRVIWWLVASAASFLIIIAIMVPERKITDAENIYGGVRITILFDSSRSMKRAEDVTPNRMAAAKDTVAAFVDMLAHDAKLKGNYQLALIPFAGTAHPSFLTFTTSREEFLSALEEINEDTISRQGTSILSALSAYHYLLKWYPPRAATTDIAILISDGGKEEGRAGEQNFFSAVINSIRETTKKIPADVTTPYVWNAVIYTMGIGRVEIDGNGKRTAQPAQLFVRDDKGNAEFYRQDPHNPQSAILTSQLDEAVLEDVARLGGGAYYHFSDTQRIAKSFGSVVLAHRRVVDTVEYFRYEPITQWFLMPAFVLWYFLSGFGDWAYWLIARMVRKKKNLSA